MKEKMRYCIQGTDITSGEVGDFGYDPEQDRSGQKRGSFYAITPIFKDLVDFFDYAKREGIQLEHCPKQKEVTND